VWKEEEDQRSGMTAGVWEIRSGGS